MNLKSIFLDDDEPVTPAGPEHLGMSAARRQNTLTATVIYDVEWTDTGEALLSVGETGTSETARIVHSGVVRLSREECDTLITRLTR